MMNIWDFIEDWLKAEPDERHIQFSHGGDGGKWYCRIEDQGSDTNADGVGESASEALQDAFKALNAT